MLPSFVLGAPGSETGLVDPTPMTTHQFAFEETDEAFALMESKDDGAIKPLIRFE